jgi:hypothetical protein
VNQDDSGPYLFSADQIGWLGFGALVLMALLFALFARASFRGRSSRR